MLLFSTQRYEYLKEKLLTNGTFQNGKIERKIFPDGEHYIRIQTPVNQEDVILIGGTISDADTLEIYDLANGMVKYGARSLTIIVPYFSYSTMERAVQEGEIVTAKTRALLFSSIPSTPFGNRIILMDLHSEGIPHYFEGGIRPVHLYCKSLIKAAATELYGQDFILASTDAGRAKWVESLANDMGVEAAFIFKKRLSGDETKITGINADVQNRNVIIYDDMIRTGGSLLQAAAAYKAAGAKQLSVITTHGIFAQNSFQRLMDSQLFDVIYTTDSHPNVLSIEHKQLRIKSISNILEDYLLTI
jgi:ribose-phosphate pyrophosphokinase